GKFFIEPLEKGYGVTIGNSLRRVLLSSIPGVAVTSVRIEGVYHEFSTIPGVKEDVLEIIKSLKQIRAKFFTDKEKKLFLDVRGPLEVKASHFSLDGEMEIINPDLHLATLDNENTHLEMEVTFSKGRGYVEAAENKKSDQPIGVIPVDSVFTPVKKVNYEVKPARIGRKTSYDSLMLEVFTDGTIKSNEAVRKAAQILDEYFQFFIVKGKIEEGKEEREKFLEYNIEEIGLPPLPLKALKSSDIEKIRDLIGKSAKDLLKLQNFGERSLQKVKEKLKKYNLSLSKSC
ncbi:MAG: DNA-directed RNA polymerase subunit alpha, partial [Candidatus Aerophobetes bacterium]|nr:DNA-directed RNA polymerase subunit alpha [Candidatus Aerophobetes bacterium]